jgi:hypothetical protein
VKRAGGGRLDGVAETLDRLCAIPLGGAGAAPVASLYGAARGIQKAPLAMLAASRLAEAAGAGRTVIITTGTGAVRDLPHGETDGPLGAAVLGRALALGLSARPVFLTEARCIRPLRAALRALEAEGPAGLGRAPVLPFPCEARAAPAAARGLLRRYRPAAVVSVEKIGPNARGVTHNMAGEDVSADHARVEALFAEADGSGIPTVAVGDRGNEIGCGLLARGARRPWSGPACACPCRGSTLCAVPAGTLVIATASNWGAYGIAAALGLLVHRPGLVHSPEAEGRMLRATLAAGARDGVTKRARPTVDGIPVATHRGLVALLRTVADRAR